MRKQSEIRYTFQLFPREYQAYRFLLKRDFNNDRELASELIYYVYKMQYLRWSPLHPSLKLKSFWYLYFRHRNETFLQLPQSPIDYRELTVTIPYKLEQGLCQFTGWLRFGRIDQTIRWLIRIQAEVEGFNPWNRERDNYCFDYSRRLIGSPSARDAYRKLFPRGISSQLIDFGIQGSNLCNLQNPLSQPNQLPKKLSRLKS